MFELALPAGNAFHGAQGLLGGEERPRAVCDLYQKSMNSLASFPTVLVLALAQVYTRQRYASVDIMGCPSPSLEWLWVFELCAPLRFVLLLSAGSMLRSPDSLWDLLPHNIANPCGRIRRYEMRSHFLHPPHVVAKEEGLKRCWNFTAHGAFRNFGTSCLALAGKGGMDQCEGVQRCAD